MTDQQNLVEDAAKLAHSVYYINDSDCIWADTIFKDDWRTVAVAMRDFWATHAEPAPNITDCLACGDFTHTGPCAPKLHEAAQQPRAYKPAEIGPVEVLRKGAEHFSKEFKKHGDGNVNDVRYIAWHHLINEVNRLEAATQQRERDVRIGRAVRQAVGVALYGGESDHPEDLCLRYGRAAREAVEANS